jgi:hypothetical protein
MTQRRRVPQRLKEETENSINHVKSGKPHRDVYLGQLDTQHRSPEVSGTLGSHQHTDGI